MGIEERILSEALVKKRWAKELASLYQGKCFDALVTEFKKLYGVVVTERYDAEPVKHPPTLLSHLILERWALKHKNLYKNLTVLIVGSGGTQKTTYAVNSGILALKRMGVDERRIVDLFLCEGDTIVATVKKLLKERKWTPFVIFDDIGAIISKYWIWLGEARKWSFFFSVVDQMKDWCGVLIMTARSPESVPKRLREISDIVIYARESYVKGATMVLMEYYDATKYNFETLRGLLMLDLYPPNARMPDWLWREMVERRRELGLKRLEEFEKESKKRKGEEDESEDGGGED